MNKKEKIISEYDKISDSKKEEKKLILNKKENVNEKKEKEWNKNNNLLWQKSTFKNLWFIIVSLYFKIISDFSSYFF